MNKEDRRALMSGFSAGFKRMDLRKVKRDVAGQLMPFVAGYALGFMVKSLLVIGAAYYGMNVPA